MAKKTVFDFNEFTARFELQTFELLPTVISGEPLTTVLTYPTTDFPDNSTLNQITTTSGYLQTAVHDGQSVDISVETDIVMDSVFIQYDPSWGDNGFIRNEFGGAYTDEIVFAKDPTNSYIQTSTIYLSTNNNPDTDFVIDIYAEDSNGVISGPSRHTISLNNSSPVISNYTTAYPAEQTALKYNETSLVTFDSINTTNVEITPTNNSYNNIAITGVHISGVGIDLTGQSAEELDTPNLVVQGFNSLNGLATSYTNYYVNYDDTEPSYEIQISYDGGNTFTPSGGSILNGAHTIKLLSDDDILSTSPEPYITGTMSTSGTVVIENSNWIHTTNTSNPYEFTNTITTSNLEGTISFSGTVSNTAGKSSSVNIADWGTFTGITDFSVTMPSTNDPFGVSNTHSHIKSGDLLIFSLTTSVAVDSVSLDFNGTSYNMTNLSSNGMDWAYSYTMTENTNFSLMVIATATTLDSAELTDSLVLNIDQGSPAISLNSPSITYPDTGQTEAKYGDDYTLNLTGTALDSPSDYVVKYHSADNYFTFPTNSGLADTKIFTMASDIDESNTKNVIATVYKISNGSTTEVTETIAINNDDTSITHAEIHWSDGTYTSFNPNNWEDINLPRPNSGSSDYIVHIITSDDLLSAPSDVSLYSDSSVAWNGAWVLGDTSKEYTRDIQVASTDIGEYYLPSIDLTNMASKTTIIGPTISGHIQYLDTVSVTYPNSQTAAASDSLNNGNNIITVSGHTSVSNQTISIPENQPVTATQLGTGTNSASGTTTVNTFLGDGTQTINIEAQDGFTNQVVSREVTFEVDDTIPIIDTLSITYPTTQSKAKTDDVVTVSGTILDATSISYISTVGDIQNSALIETNKTLTITTTEFTNSGDNYTVTASKSTNGTQSIANTEVLIENRDPNVTLEWGEGSNWYSFTTGNILPSNQYSLLLRVNSNIPLNSEVGTEPSVTLSGIINSSFVSVGTLAATEEDNTIWTGSIDFTGTPTGTYQVGLTSANSLSNKISTSSNEDGTYHFQTIDNISIGYPSGAFHGTPYTQTAVTTGDDLSIEVIIPNISDLYDNYTLSTNTSDLHDSLSNISNVGNVISGTIGITTNEYIGENNTSITYTNNNTGYSVFKLTPNFIIDHTSPNISLTQLNYDLTDDALHVDTADGNLNYNTTISNISDIDELVFYESLIIGRLSINNPSVYEDPKVISSGVTDPSEINIPTVVATTFSSSAPNANGGVFINADTWTTDTNIISLKVRILDNNGSLWTNEALYPFASASNLVLKVSKQGEVSYFKANIDSYSDTANTRDFILSGGTIENGNLNISDGDILDLSIEYVEENLKFEVLNQTNGLIGSAIEKVRIDTSESDIAFIKYSLDNINWFLSDLHPKREDTVYVKMYFTDEMADVTLTVENDNAATESVGLSENEDNNTWIGNFTIGESDKSFEIIEVSGNAASGESVSITEDLGGIHRVTWIESITATIPAGQTAAKFGDNITFLIKSSTEFVSVDVDTDVVAATLTYVDGDTETTNGETFYIATETTAVSNNLILGQTISGSPADSPANIDIEVNTAGPGSGYTLNYNISYVGEDALFQINNRVPTFGDPSYDYGTVLTGDNTSTLLAVKYESTVDITWDANTIYNGNEAVTDLVVTRSMYGVESNITGWNEEDTHTANTPVTVTCANNSGDININSNDTITHKLQATWPHNGATVYASGYLKIRNTHQSVSISLNNTDNYYTLLNLAPTTINPYTLSISKTDDDIPVVNDYLDVSSNETGLVIGEQSYNTNVWTQDISVAPFNSSSSLFTVSGYDDSGEPISINHQPTLAANAWAIPTITLNAIPNTSDGLNHKGSSLDEWADRTATASSPTIDNRYNPDGQNLFSKYYFQFDNEAISEQEDLNYIVSANDTNSHTIGVTISGTVAPDVSNLASQTVQWADHFSPVAVTNILDVNNTDITGAFEVETTPGSGVEYKIKATDSSGCVHNRTVDFTFHDSSVDNDNNYLDVTPVVSTSLVAKDTSTSHVGTTVNVTSTITNAGSYSSDSTYFTVVDLAPTASIAVSSPTPGNPTNSTTNIANVLDGTTSEYLIFGPSGSTVGDIDNYISHTWECFDNNNNSISFYTLSTDIWTEQNSSLVVTDFTLPDLNIGWDSTGVKTVRLTVNTNSGDRFIETDITVNDRAEIVGTPTLYAKGTTDSDVFYNNAVFEVTASIKGGFDTGGSIVMDCTELRHIIVEDGTEIEIWQEALDINYTDFPRGGNGDSNAITDIPVSSTEEVDENGVTIYKGEFRVYIPDDIGTNSATNVFNGGGWSSSGPVDMLDKKVILTATDNYGNTSEKESTLASWHKYRCYANVPVNVTTEPYTGWLLNHVNSTTGNNWTTEPTPDSAFATTNTNTFLLKDYTILEVPSAVNLLSNNTIQSTDWSLLPLDSAGTIIFNESINNRVYFDTSQSNVSNTINTYSTDTLSYNIREPF